MAEIYAKDADIKDDRVKEMAFTDAELTEKAYTESTMLVKEDTGSKAGTKKEEPKEEVTTLEKVKEFTEEEYKVEKEEAEAIKDDGARSADDQAAGEIIEEIAKKKEEEKKEEREGAIQYFSDSRTHFISSFKVKLYKKVVVEDILVEKELDRRIERQKQTKEELLTKFSKVASFADRLLKASETAAKAMTAPVQKTDKKYEDL